jgi:hypothetical protein
MEENNEQLGRELGMVIGLNITYTYYSTTFALGDAFERENMFKRFKTEDITREVAKQYPEDFKFYFNGFCELFKKVRESGAPVPEKSWQDQYAAAVSCTNVELENPDLPTGDDFSDFEYKLFGRLFPKDIIYMPKSGRIIRLKDVTIDDLEKMPEFRYT